MSLLEEADERDQEWGSRANSGESRAPSTPQGEVAMLDGKTKATFDCTFIRGGWKQYLRVSQAAIGPSS